MRSSGDELRRLLVKGVEHTDGILSNASVIRGSLIRELVGSISSAGFCSTKNLFAVSSTGSAGADGAGSVTMRRPRPRPRPRGFAMIAGRSL